MKNTQTDNKTESVLKEALLEYEQVLKAAKTQVVENNKKELDSLVEKFLKESVEKKEPVLAENKESNKQTVQESIMVQKPIGEMSESIPAVASNTINMKEASLAEVEAAFDNAQPNDDFQVVRNDAPQQAVVPAPQQSPTSAPAVGGNDNFDLSSIEGEIEGMMQEINQVQEIEAQQQAQQQMQQQQQANPIDKFKKMYEEMGNYLKEIDEMNATQQLMEEFHSKMSDMYGESYKAQMDESKVNELFDMYKKGKSGKSEKPAEKVQEVATVAPGAEQVVDEQHGSTLSGNKLVGQESQPRLDYGKEYAAQKVRLALQKESIEKKMTALLKENMNLTKTLNSVKGDLDKTKKSLSEATSKTKDATTLNENYKNALEKYREQLKEMAVLNTNISYVNNLLVTEGLALSFEDKKNIIDRFKKVGSINESEKVYKQTLKEFTETKKQPITETIESRMASTIIESSSKNQSQVIEESINKNGDVSDEQVSKMLRLSGITPKRSVM